MREELLTLLDWVYRQELRFIASLPEHARNNEGTYEDWSGKDTVAHMAEWKRYMSLVIGKVDDNGTERKSELPSDPIDTINRRIFDYHKAMSLPNVVQMHKLAHQTIRMLTDRTFDQVLRDPEHRRFEWSNSDSPVWKCTVSSVVTRSHIPRFE